MRGKFSSSRPSRVAAALASLVVLQWAAFGRADVRPLPRVTATVLTRHPGPMIPRSFLGLSIEYGPTINNMVASRYHHRHSLERLLNTWRKYNGAPILRIGGNSEDMAAWNLPALHPARAGVTIDITPRFCRNIRSLCRKTDAKLILGINLGRGNIAMAKAWVRHALADIGGRHILAFEIGNEPDAYGLTHQRPNGFTSAEYEVQFSSFAKAIAPLLPRRNMIAGPAFSCFWLKNQTADFIRDMHGMLGLVTIHDYPLGIRRAIPRRSSVRFDSIAHLLDHRSSHIYYSILQKTVMAARRYHLPVRWGEMNSAAGGGDQGISDSFASVLWLTDAMFNAVRGGATGVNLHNAGAALCPYSVFTYNRMRRLVPHPDYYAMLLFARASENRSRLLPVKMKSRVNVRIEATQEASGVVHIVIINKQISQGAEVKVKLPGYSAAKAIRLSASSVRATSEPVLTGWLSQSRGAAPADEGVTIAPRHGCYTIKTPVACIEMLTVLPRR